MNTSDELTYDGSKLKPVGLESKQQDIQNDHFPIAKQTSVELKSEASSSSNISSPLREENGDITVSVEDWDTWTEEGIRKKEFTVYKVVVIAQGERYVVFRR